MDHVSTVTRGCDTHPDRGRRPRWTPARRDEAPSSLRRFPDSDLLGATSRSVPCGSGPTVHLRARPSRVSAVAGLALPVDCPCGPPPGSEALRSFVRFLRAALT